MKMRVVVLLAGACALVFSAVFAPAAAAIQDPLLGKWKSTDPYDQSSQSLTIGGGPAGTYHVQYRDDGASVCDTPPGSGELLYAATANGVFTFSDGVLRGNLEVYCLDAGHTSKGDFLFELTPNADDTLSQVTGIYTVIWSH